METATVYVKIDPGTPSVVASPSFLVELLFPIFCAVFTGILCFLVVAREIFLFYASPRTCSLAQSNEEPPAHLKKKKTRWFVFGSWKGDNSFENMLK